MARSPEKAFHQLLEKLKVNISSFDPSKVRTAVKSTYGTSSIDSFKEKLWKDMRPHIKEFVDISDTLGDSSMFEDLLESYASKKGLKAEEKKQKTVPPEFQGLTLYVDQSYQGREARFFVVTPENYVSGISGSHYIKKMGLSEAEASEFAISVTPQYSPRTKKGTFEIRGTGSETLTAFNTYVPPLWRSVRDLDTPEELPKLFRDLVEHLFPLEIEREYFFSWLYHSLFERSYVYLVLCGDPGTGKNRLKLILRALHGHTNTVDGKKSTLIDRFNSQLTESTLVWFDELRYSMDMENVMKELPNDSISIERKGVDATKSTKLFSSFVISNNKPRDNYLAFDARKFAPLLITKKKLPEVMSKERIDKLTKKVEDPTHPDFDPIFLAKIAKWIKKYAKRDMFPNLEYRGPMFWRLAHTSMSRWQKMAASIILSTPKDNMGKLQYEKNLGFKWSVAEEMLTKKGKQGDTLADYSTVMHFFEVFRDGAGQPVFKTTPIKGNAMGDFYVKVINKNAKILNEADVLMEIEGDKRGKKESGEEGREKTEKKNIGNKKPGLRKKFKLGRRLAEGTARAD